MSLDPLTYLDALRASLEQGGAAPEILELIKKCNYQYSHKWWHEVSESLIEALRHPLVRAVAYDVHKHVAMPIRLDMSTTNYAKILFSTVQAISGTEEGGAQAHQILDGAATSIIAAGGSNQQGLHCVQCIRAMMLMSDGPSIEGKHLIDAAEEYLETLQPHEIEPVLQAILTKAQCRLHELSGAFSKFYETVFLMLSYCDRCGLIPQDEEYAAIAYKTALAALLSDSVHSFGQLLTCDSLTSRLSKGGDAWLLNLVQFCNAGNVTALEAFLQTNLATINTCPELNGALPHLKRKVRLMALPHLVFNTRADSRVFTFETLASRCNVDLKSVETLLLQALALHLIEGRVDGLESKVEVTWLQPRVVDKDDIAALAARVKEWRAVAKKTAENVGRLAQEVPS